MKGIARTGWRPIETAPEDVRWVAAHARPPQVGQLAGQVFALSEGRWLVVKFHVTRGAPESYFILPEPPATVLQTPR